MLPRRCDTIDPVTGEACGPDVFVVLGERSRYVDQQTLKLQVRWTRRGGGGRVPGSGWAEGACVRAAQRACGSGNGSTLRCVWPASPVLACAAARVAPQERPEDIPTGELPRTLLMVVDRHLVGRVTPGSRLVVTGIYCTHRCGAACVCVCVCACVCVCVFAEVPVALSVGSSAPTTAGGA
jgi:DNA replicative helicase MCM subunit Mcm2 (Cdc46/Mcm family)